MSGIRALFNRYKSECETGDQHVDTELRTHYYKSGFDKVFQKVVELYSSSSYRVMSESKDRGEITIEHNGNPNLFIVVTIVTVRPFETAVDFKLSTRSFSPLGNHPRLKKFVLTYYAELDKELTKI